jgi:hypothetical protein
MLDGQSVPRTLAFGIISQRFYLEILLRIKPKVKSSVKYLAAFTNDFTTGKSSGKIRWSRDSVTRQTQFT